MKLDELDWERTPSGLWDRYHVDYNMTIYRRTHVGSHVGHSAYREGYILFFPTKDNGYGTYDYLVAQCWLLDYLQRNRSAA